LTLVCGGKVVFFITRFPEILNNLDDYANKITLIGR
jgi:hypothetical protein